MVRSVRVREVLPSLHDLAERSGKSNCSRVVDELIDHLAEFVATSWVRPHPSEFGNLGHADVAVQQRVTDDRMVVQEASLAAAPTPASAGDQLAFARNHALDA